MFWARRLQGAAFAKAGVHFFGPGTAEGDGVREKGQVGMGLERVRERLEPGLERVRERLEPGLERVRERLEPELERFRERLEPGLEQVRARFVEQWDIGSRGVERPIEVPDQIEMPNMGSSNLNEASSSNIKRLPNGSEPETFPPDSIHLLGVKSIPNSSDETFEEIPSPSPSAVPGPKKWTPAFANPCSTSRSAPARRRAVVKRSFFKAYPVVSWPSSFCRFAI